MSRWQLLTGEKICDELVHARRLFELQEVPGICDEFHPHVRGHRGLRCQHYVAHDAAIIFAVQVQQWLRGHFAADALLECGEVGVAGSVTECSAVVAEGSLQVVGVAQCIFDMSKIGNGCVSR